MTHFIKTPFCAAALGLALVAGAVAPGAQAQSLGAAHHQILEIEIPQTCMALQCTHSYTQAGLLDELGKGLKDVGKGIGGGVKTIGDGVKDIGQGIGDGIGAVFEGGKKDKVRAESRKHGQKIQAIARDIRKALPKGKDARALANAIKNKDGRAVQALLRSNIQLRQSFNALERMGFNTVTVGIESSGSYFVGGAHETGFTMDMDFDRTPRVYTTTSLSGGYHFGGGNDLVFSFFKAGYNRIGGHAFGSIAEFDVGTGAGVNMWFSAKPFDFAGFSIGVGIGSVGGGGAVTYALTKVWN